MSPRRSPLPVDAHRRRHLLRQAACLAGGGVVLLGLGACGRSGAPASATSEADTRPAPAGGKVYAIGTDASYAPFESQDDKGDFVGFDIELLQAVVASVIDVEFINTPWEGLITALEQGDLDAAVSAIAVTPERRQALDFTTPYFEAQQLVVVPAASPVRTLQDLRRLRVGVQDSTAGDDIVTTLFAGKEGSQVQRLESLPLALTELEAGTVDAVIGDNGVLAHYVTHGGGAPFRLVDDPSFEKESYAIAVKKGQTELLDKLEKGLAALRADGRFAALYRRYFGTLKLPASMDTAVAASR